MSITRYPAEDARRRAWALLTAIDRDPKAILRTLGA